MPWQAARKDDTTAVRREGWRVVDGGVGSLGNTEEEGFCGLGWRIKRDDIQGLSGEAAEAVNEAVAVARKRRSPPCGVVLSC